MNWIKTSDRLPEEGQEVLIYLSSKKFMLGFLEKKYSFKQMVIDKEYFSFVVNFNHESDEYELSHVEYWMSMPEAPKE